MDAETKTIDIYCPTCNVQVAASILFTHAHAEPRHGGIIGDLCDTPHAVTTYSLSECSRCNEVFLTKAEFYEIPGEVCAPQTGDITLYPLPRNLDTSVLPPTIAKSCTSATGSFNAGLYEPCVIMCRKSVEALCHEKGITSGNLKSRIDRLHNDGHIDQKLHTWANGLRLVGNDAAHDIAIEITKEDAADSIGFLEALLLYSFVLEQKFQDFQTRRASQQAT
ncbi:DUF4145 domain-containing protein [Gimesia sp.]|uniref:DUF4145 domain-containing protein n=1 Tax=Gimesia sp. TaxID=2024833 RepID=UPI000C574A9D|nr:DUF4145 domain-containing protein [Gimesia sp.]MAX38227.1 hypothetical protein [Gimesia sp.]HAH47923.1 hypothetical protein [Planctomycetaceae bacterium]|tara:strand:+ start:379 stop:1044 length:666 start_codon:yes stop_codon:yes gene_type:complete